MDNFLRHAHKFCLDIVPQYYTRILLCMGMLGHPLYWCVSSARPTAIFETFVAPERFGQPTGMCITRGGGRLNIETNWSNTKPTSGCGVGKIAMFPEFLTILILRCFHPYKLNLDHLPTMPNSVKV